MPVTTAVEIHKTVQSITNKQREAAQSAPRPARVRFMVSVAGTGEYRLLGGAALKFATQMMDEPSFSYGIVAVDSIPTGGLPLASATVLSYLKTNTGLYYGAEVGFKVESGIYNIRLKFSLTFEASALRNTAGASATGTGTTGDQNVFTGQDSYDQYQAAALDQMGSNV